jgi:hypothetical protein
LLQLPVFSGTQNFGKYSTGKQNMAQEIIDIGASANDGAGDPLRTAFTKTNNNFSQLFAAGGVSGISNGTSNITIVNNGSILMSASNVANVVTVTSTGATVKGVLTGTRQRFSSGQCHSWRSFF